MELSAPLRRRSLARSCAGVSVASNVHALRGGTMRYSRCFLAVLIVGISIARYGSAYPVQKSLGLAELEKQADLICKVEAGSSRPADTSPFRNVPGFEV